jgi:hypothetical protein
MGDFGVTVSWETIKGGIDFVIFIFISARVARKAVPDGKQNGLLGTVLKHAALEINPQSVVGPPK